MHTARGYTTWIVLLLFGLIVVPPVMAESVPSLDVPYYSQNVGAWSTEHLGSNPFFIRDAGCALTSLAMVFAYYGLSVDPSTLNTWLTLHNGYDEQGNIRWKTAAEISTVGTTRTINLDEADDVKTWATTLDSPVPADLAVINQYLQSGCPVLAKVWYTDFNYEGGWHWVVLTGYSLINHSTRYTILDPYIDPVNINGLSATTIPDPRFYERQNGGAAGTIYGIVVFRRISQETGLTAGDDSPSWAADDPGVISSISIPALSPVIPFGDLDTPPLNSELIPKYPDMARPGSGGEISPPAGSVPVPEAGNDTPGRESPWKTDQVPYSALYPLAFPSFVLPELPVRAAPEDAGSLLLPPVQAGGVDRTYADGMRHMPNIPGDLVPEGKIFDSRG